MNEQEALHLKVRGVALWIKTLKGPAPSIVDSAFETLLQAAEELQQAKADRSGDLMRGWGIPE